MARDEAKPLYLPLEIDGKRHAALCARALGLHPGIVLWGLSELWEHVWRTHEDVISDLMLDACFTPEPRLRDALVAFGFIEKVPAGWRVRGAKRWLFGQREAGSKGGQKTASSGKSLRNLRQNKGTSTEALIEAAPKHPSKHHRSDSEAHPPPNTQHPTPNEPPPPVVAVEPEADPAEHPPTGDGCWRWIQEQRAERGLPPELHRPRGFSDWHDKALERFGPGGVMRAWESFVRDKDFEPKGWPTAVFITPGVFDHRAEAARGAG